jgi:hypothetical protein
MARLTRGSGESPVVPLDDELELEDELDDELLELELLELNDELDDELELLELELLELELDEEPEEELEDALELESELPELEPVVLVPEPLVDVLELDEPDEDALADELDDDAEVDEPDEDALALVDEALPVDDVLPCTGTQTWSVRSHMSTGWPGIGSGQRLLRSHPAFQSTRKAQPELLTARPPHTNHDAK